MNKIINDDFLYINMPIVEEYMLEKIPDEKNINHVFSKKFEHKMKALLKYEQRTPFFRKTLAYTKRAAIIVLMLMTIALAGVMSIEAYRVKIFKVITEVLKEYTSISIIKEDLDDTEIIPIEPTYIPEGYTLFEKNIETNAQYVFYRNDKNEKISFHQIVNTEHTYLLDTKGVEVKTVKLSDYDIYTVSNKGFNQIFWVDNTNNYTFIGTVDMDELLKMAETIIDKK